MSNPAAAASGQGNKKKSATCNTGDSGGAARGAKEDATPTEATEGDASRTASSTAADGASGGPKSFEFVLVTDSGSRKQVRRHAMRRYVHQRRMDGIARLESTRVQVPGWVKGNSASEQASSSSSKVEELDDDDDDVNPRDPAGGSGEGNNDDGVRDPKAERQQRQRRRSQFVPSTTSSGRQLSLAQLPTSTSPSVTLSSVASDPFNSFPVQLHQSDRNLIHHCKQTPTF